MATYGYLRDKSYNELVSIYNTANSATLRAQVNKYLQKKLKSDNVQNYGTAYIDKKKGIQFKEGANVGQTNTTDPRVALAQLRKQGDKVPLSQQKRKIEKNGVIYEYDPVRRSYIQTSITPAEMARRARIRSGTATGRDFVKRDADANTQFRTIVSRLGETQTYDSFRTGKDFSGREITNSQKYKVNEIAKIFDKLTGQSKKKAEEILKRSEDVPKTFLEKRSINIAKRQKTSEKFIYDLNTALKGKSNKFAESVTRKTKQPQWVTNNPVSNYIRGLTVDLVTSFPDLALRTVNAMDKLLFLAQSLPSNLRQDGIRAYGTYLNGLFNKKQGKSTIISVKQALKDPAVYVFALLGARKGVKVVESTKKVPTVRSSVQPNTMYVIKDGRVYITDAAGRLTKITNNVALNVAKVRTALGTIRKVTPELRLERRINRFMDNQALQLQKIRAKAAQTKKITTKTAKEQGFASVKEFQKWKDLSAKTDVKSARALSVLEKKVQTRLLKSQISKAKALQKSKLSNLKKAQSARKGKLRPSKTKIQAKSIRELRKKPILERTKKATQTKANLRKKGFNSLKEQRLAERFGLKTGAKLKEFRTMLRRAALGDKKANAFVDKVLSRAKKTNVKKTRVVRKGENQVKLALRAKELVGELPKPPKIKTKLVLRSLFKDKKGSGYFTVEKYIYERKVKVPKSELSKLKKGAKYKTVRLTRLKVSLAPRISAVLAATTRLRIGTLLKPFQNLKLSLTPAEAFVLKSRLSNVIDVIQNIKLRQATKRKLGLRMEQKLVLEQAISKIPKKRVVKKTKTPKKAVVPRPKLPERKKSNTGTAYDVYVKSGTRYVKANVYKLTQGKASALGRYITGNTLSASFYVRKTTGRPTKAKVSIPNVAKSQFRTVKGKSKLQKTSSVEKRKYRLNTRGEKKKITAARLIAKRKKKLSKARKR